MINFKIGNIVREQNEIKDFEGPLSVILALLNKNKIEIRDIRVSDILEQYLSFIGDMDVDLDSASEFVQMASHLVYIKTRMLLVEEKEVTELEQLIDTLEALQNREGMDRLKHVLQGLDDAYATGSRLMVKPPEPIKRSSNYAYRHENVELLRALYSVYTRTTPGVGEESAASLMPKPIVYSVSEKSREIVEHLRAFGSSPLDKLYDDCRSRSEIVATFIAVLELCGVGRLMLSDDLTIRLGAGGDDDVGDFATSLDAN